MNATVEAGSRTTSYPVNGVIVEFADHVITAREALTRSGHTPASEHKLILVRDQRTRLIGTDDEIDLKKEKGGALRAFRSDRSYSFTVDEIGQVWGNSEMEVDEFLSIWPPRGGFTWVLERDAEPDTVLVAGGVLSFGEQGVEDVVSRKDEHPNKVKVIVVTTAGTFPAEGAKRYPSSTRIEEVLADAARKLHITGTETWVVTSAGQVVNPTQTFQQAGLTGLVTLEWGPPEGGGGA
ncbi:MAG: hypothetical protein AB7T40_00750 [Alphaproteobacteria bacterium]